MKQPQRPDRLERVVENALRAIEPDNKPDWIAIAVFSGLAVKLLRSDRARMKRKVRGLQKACRNGHAQEPHTRATHSQCDMYQLALDDVLKLWEE